MQFKDLQQMVAYARVTFGLPVEDTSAMDSLCVEFADVIAETMNALESRFPGIDVATVSAVLVTSATQAEALDAADGMQQLTRDDLADFSSKIPLLLNLNVA